MNPRPQGPNIVVSRWIIQGLAPTMVPAGKVTEGPPPFGFESGSWSPWGGGTVRSRGSGRGGRGVLGPLGLGLMGIYMRMWKIGMIVVRSDGPARSGLRGWWRRVGRVGAGGSC